MGAPKYAKRTDGNHTEITEALRPYCLRVWTIHTPLDVLCWSKTGVIVQFEIKATHKKRSDQKEQQALLDLAIQQSVHCYRVESPEEAVDIMRDINSERTCGFIHNWRKDRHSHAPGKGT